MDMGQQRNGNNAKPEVLTYNPKELEFSASNYELHPDGKFKAKVTELKMRVQTYQGKTPQKEIGLVFTTEHVQENGENAQVIKWGSPTVSSRSFFGKYVEAIGEDIEELQQLIADGKFDARDYINRVCSIVIVHEPRKDGEGDYAKIASVNAPDKKKGKTAAAPTTTAPVEEAEAPPAQPTTPRPNFDDEDEE